MEQRTNPKTMNIEHRFQKHDYFQFLIVEGYKYLLLNLLLYAQKSSQIMLLDYEDSGIL